MSTDHISFIYDGGAVQRFHTARLLKPVSVAEHSWGVAMLAEKLGGSADCILYCLKHDLAEQTVGDIPSPSKRRFNISAQIQAYEDSVLSEAGVALPKLCFEDHKIFKLADCFDGMMTCINERKLGNKTLGIVFSRYASYVAELKPEDLALQMFNDIKVLWMKAN